MAFSLRAWAPVFASIERVLGSDIFGRLHPDWREDQRRAVEDACAAKKGRVWVADVQGDVVGFVSVEVFDAGRSMGEISMLAVDPDHQGRGVGTTLGPSAPRHTRPRPGENREEPPGQASTPDRAPAEYGLIDSERWQCPRSLSRL